MRSAQGTPHRRPDSGGPLSGQRSTERTLVLLGILLVLAGGILAYSNSLSGGFFFDDHVSIVENQNIRDLWPLARVVNAPPDQPIAGRPLVAVTLAFNYAISGLDVWSYHLFNLAAHLLAGLLLFEILRRTLSLGPGRHRFSRRAVPLSAAAAFLWTIHPLQTESVTYIVQRAEAMVGFFYLLTIYGLIRGTTAAGARPRRAWLVAGVISCALGMLTKEVMITAPIIAFLYDRIFLSSSFREVVRKRGWFHAGLAATWSILLVIIASAPRGGTTGFDMAGLGPMEYARSQFGVILHYLRLSFWPHPLVLDYGWKVARSASEIALPAAAILVLLLATLQALRRRPALGFIGVWFFAILAPTSSIIPIQDLCFEHRMYLPLAAVITLAVLGAYAAGGAVLRRLGRGSSRSLGWGLGICLVLGSGALLGAHTHARNRDYHDEVSFCRREAILRPDNWRTHRNLGMALVRVGRLAESIPLFEKSIALRPNNAIAHCNLGNSLALLGRPEDAMSHYKEAIRLKPAYAEAYANQGRLLAEQGQRVEAVESYERALQIRPDLFDARLFAAHLLASLGRDEAALRHYRSAVSLRPAHIGARNGLAWLLATSPIDAIRDGRQAVALAEAFCAETGFQDPSLLDTLAAACAESGRFEDAARWQGEAIRRARSADPPRGDLDDLAARLALYQGGRPFRRGTGSPS
ncbi:MAG: tetratricopeptide repeat protein [Candidatus Eisenbacteria bacterium]|nr:tetratricopeptide repeat protein [Candidatus Eisenbacteria bacterium]